VFNATGAPVAAEHVRELPPGEVRQLVKPDQADLRALPVEAVALILHVGERDAGTGGEPPFELLFSGGGLERRIDLGTVVPEAALGPDLHSVLRKDDGAEPGDVRPLERGRGGGRRTYRPPAAPPNIVISGVRLQKGFLRPSCGRRPRRSRVSLEHTRGRGRGGDSPSTHR